MTTDPPAARVRAHWMEEQLRYEILKAVYEHPNAALDESVAGYELGPLLELRSEDLFRVIHFLEYNGYLDYLGAGPRVRITSKGLRYIEQTANRRRSVRNPDLTFGSSGSS